MSTLLNITRNYGILIVTLLLFVVLALTTDGFLSGRNLRNILDQQSGVLIAASFVTILMISGNFDISTSAIAVVAPLSALWVENATGNVPFAVLAGLTAGLVMGAFNGAVVSRLRVDSFIATLATSFMFFGAGYLISDRSIMRPVGDAWRAIARSRVFEVTTASWIAIICVIIAAVILHRMRFGRNVYAIGANREAARLAGVSVERTVIICFILAAVAGALAGILSSSRIASARPSDDFSFVFTVFTAVIVGGNSISGGTGAIWRTVVAVFFLAFLANGFNLLQIDPIWQRMIEGLVILLAVGIDSWSKQRTG